LLDQLVAAGGYVDYSQAINVALSNLGVLRQEMSSGAEVVVGEHDQRGNAGTAERQTSFRRTLEHARPAQRGRRSLDAHASRAQEPEIPALFRLPHPVPAERTAPLPDDVFFVGQGVPVERWVFGQYNRLLPVKASCRALLNLSATYADGFDIGKVSSEIAQEAVSLAEYLSHHDTTNRSVRDDAISIGFPLRTENVDRSRLRYANQFVAMVNKQRRVSGLLIDLKLINQTPDRVPRIALTKTGWEFAALPNPILDGGHFEVGRKFSEPERELLLQHIEQSVPVEDFAYRSILRAIKAGHATPETIDEALQADLASDRRQAFGKQFLASQRSGAISRMSDLELVSRVRDGVRVSYAITDRGTAYLNL
jgi:hypothetical protein